jgi:hypothetical protein
MATDEGPSVGRILVVLVPFLVITAPLVAVLWEAVNDVMDGRLARLTLALPLLLVVLVVLVVFGRALQRLDQAGHAPGSRNAGR